MSSKYGFLIHGLAIAGFSCLIVASIMSYTSFDALTISMIAIGGIAMVVAQLMNIHKKLAGPSDSDYLQISYVGGVQVDKGLDSKLRN